MSCWDPVVGCEADIKAAVAAEREAAAAHADRFADEVANLVERRRVPAADASLLQRRLREFARGIRLGFHVEGN